MVLWRRSARGGSGVSPTFSDTPNGAVLLTSPPPSLPLPVSHRALVSSSSTSLSFSLLLLHPCVRSFAASSFLHAAPAPKRRGRPVGSVKKKSAPHVSSSARAPSGRRDGGSLPSKKRRRGKQVTLAEDEEEDEDGVRDFRQAPNDNEEDGDLDDLARRYAGSEELLDSVGVSLERSTGRRGVGNAEEDEEEELEYDVQDSGVARRRPRSSRGLSTSASREDDNEDLVEEEEGDELDSGAHGGRGGDGHAEEEHEEDELERRVQEGSRALIHLHPDIALEYDEVGNAKSAVPLEALSAHSPSLVCWQCRKCQHRWRAAVFVRCTLKAGCPACKEKENPTVASAHPELVPFWDPERNDPFLTLDKVPIDSKHSIVWRCPSCTHTYPARVKDQVVRNKVFCPHCGKDLYGEAPQRKVRKRSGVPRPPKIRQIKVEDDPEVEARIAAAVEKIAAIRRAEREAAAAAAAENGAGANTSSPSS